MPLQLSTLRAPELVAEVKAELEPIILRSKLTITRRRCRGTCRRLSSDRQKVKQILLNLLSNALKFTHHGGVTDQRAAQRRASGRSTLSVADTGIGIAAGRSGEDLRGLPAARQLADARLRRHRARPVDLPPAGPDARRTHHACRASRQGLDVHPDAADQGTEMTARDPNARACCSWTTIPDAREMYAEYLRVLGLRRRRGGQRRWRRSQRAVDSAPDIILMDLSLPVMDGWEATRRLKADERDRRDPGRRAHRPRAGRHLGGREEGRLRRVRHQAVPARRSRQRNPEGARTPRRVQQEEPQERQTCENQR